MQNKQRNMVNSPVSQPDKTEHIYAHTPASLAYMQLEHKRQRNEETKKETGFQPTLILKWSVPK